MKFIEVSSINSIDVKVRDPEINAQFRKECFASTSEKQSAVETALESLIDKRNSAEYDLIFKSPVIGLLINVEEISHMSEIVSTIDGFRPQEKFWQLMPRATEIILKDGTKKIVKESIFNIKIKIDSIR